MSENRDVRRAWKNLAADILLLAIEDVRQVRDPNKRKWAKFFLLSPAAQLFFDEILDPHFDIQKWIEADCPRSENK